MKASGNPPALVLELWASKSPRRPPQHSALTQGQNCQEQRKNIDGSSSKPLTPATGPSTGPRGALPGLGRGGCLQNEFCVDT